MASNPQRPEGRDDVLSKLGAGIETLSLAKDTSSVAPVRAIFESVTDLLKTIGVCSLLSHATTFLFTLDQEPMFNQQGYIELGLNCAEICGALDRGTKGKRTKDISRPVHEAINQLTTIVAEVQKKVTKERERNPASRIFRAESDKDKITAWKLDLNRILHIFDTSVHGESPPPPPRACFGRNELIEKVVCLAENLEPVALIGAGGTGKTSIALTVLHNDRIKKRFGDNRRFIPCDQFPASLPHLLNRLSKAIGAGIENPKDLTPLRPFLSSRDMILFLDNAESIFDPQGTDAREIYTTVQELSRFSNICLGITSRITTVPPHFKRPVISTLSPEAACDIFYSIYDNGGRSEVISDLIRQLDFHALSITLLATTASHNLWDYNRLAKEWDVQRAQVLQTDYNESLAATIEISLASPTFRNLGPHARDLLGVVAFFPQGVAENNLDWLFPTIPNRRNIFDKFCVLSLASRSDNFITMLAPIRDYLRPRDPNLSPLICATRDHYFTRLSVNICPREPGFKEARWIVSEDMNVEYLLDVFIPIDIDLDIVWDACIGFMRHLYWHKGRYTVLGPKVEGLADEHRFKPTCLIELSRLSYSVGNYAEQKRLLSLALKLVREREDDYEVARTLSLLSRANRGLGLHEEGIHQSKEALGIFERLGNTIRQAGCWNLLAWLFRLEGRLDEAEEAGSHAIYLLPEKGQESLVCESHRSLGEIYRFKMEREKAIHHFEKALGIASAFEWHSQIFWIHHSLADLFLAEGGFDEAHLHIDQSKLHTAGNAYELGRAMDTKARIWYRQGRLEDALSEASGALEVFEKLGASRNVVSCKGLLRDIEQEIAEHGTPSSASANTSPSH
ncbi:hypothetical protein BJ322DRAFT_1215331 [Thelephora terrestris]|uniref:TPR-like protein n=1 Tax=Thelephora terrestris TaxID=56493 RepID=A0A9P6LC94_9AGAM|nr:hypothetical protein BJ322DRAFT_1215331 [Thelephora terrestris]